MVDLILQDKIRKLHRKGEMQRLADFCRQPTVTERQIIIRVSDIKVR